MTALWHLARGKNMEQVSLWTRATCTVIRDERYEVTKYNRRLGLHTFSQVLSVIRLECGEYRTIVLCEPWQHTGGVLHVGNLTRACKNSLHVYTTQCLKSQYLMNPLFMAKYPQQNNIRHSTTNFCTITQWPSSNFAWPESLVRIHVQPGPAHHRHLGLGTFHKKPPSVQILSWYKWIHKWNTIWKRKPYLNLGTIT